MHHHQQMPSFAGKSMTSNNENQQNQHSSIVISDKNQLVSESLTFANNV